MAEKLKFPAMATLPFHLDYTILYGVEFEDNTFALPFLFEGAIYLFGPKDEEILRAPF